MNLLIAIVDDEPDILELVSLNLSKAGFRTREFADGETFMRFINTAETPSLVILDLMLPDTDGLELCKFLRTSAKHSSTPIIMLTAKTDETDKVLGLELGADDYITKPFSPRELVARVKTVLRRRQSREEVAKLDVGGVVAIDPEKFEVVVRGQKIDLTPTEFKILQLLASRKGRIYSREQILDFLWGQDKLVVDRTIDVHIRHLREKMGDAAKYVKNVRGVGYKLEE
jgi:DNA-binding response OmpR family regulator